MPSPTPSAQQLHKRRAFGFVLMSALLPGSVQSFAGNRGVGRLAGRVYGAAAALVVLVGLGLWLVRGFTVGLLLTPSVTFALRIALWALFVGWLLLLMDSWRLARPLTMPRRPRLWLTITTILLALAVGAFSSAVANALVAVENVGTVLPGGGERDQKAGRYNVLLLGADSAEHREGLRPDSINVASIDARTGRTVLFGLPRNLERVRFPKDSPLRDLYPEGYVCDGGACMLNGIYTLGQDHADLYDARDPGLAALKEAIEETLGIELNYYAMVDMAGFTELIDAMGGIRLDIGKPVPIGGVSTRISGYIEPGENRLLDGYHALWFARSRAESSDYERMVRQKCVMAAMVNQLNPTTVAMKFVELSEAGANLVRTDVGTGHVMELAELALKAKDLKLASVNFTPPLIVAADPDFDLIRSTVAAKIAESERLDDRRSAPSASASPATVPTTSTVAASERPAATASSAVSQSDAPAAAQPSASGEPFTETADLAEVCSAG